MIENLVSTVIPVYNRAAMLREAVASVLAQTWRPIEIIIVDDGSTDDTPAIAAEIANRHPEIVRVLRQSNAGPGVARQLGLEDCRGEFMQFLDSDDLLLPEKFASQVKVLNDHPDHAASYGWTSQYKIEEPGSKEPAKWTGHKFETLFPSMLALRWWDTSTPLYRHSVLREIGPWTSLRQEEDWEYDCRLAARGARIVQVDQLVSETRFVGGGTLSSGGSHDQAKLRDRCAARLAILGHAKNAQINSEAPEMQTFLKSSFLVARQSAAVGLEMESRELVEAIHAVSPRLLSSLFLKSGRVVGFRPTARLAEAAYRFIKGNAGDE